MSQPPRPEAPPAGAYSIRAVQRVCDLLDLIQQAPDGISLGHAAAVTKLPKSSAFRYLSTLEQRRYVARDPATGSYRLGLGLLPIHAHQVDVLVRTARPYLERLTAFSAETSNIGLLDGSQVIYLDIVESPHAMRLAARPGDRDALHATALGKALAANLPAERVLEILATEGMPRLTDRTITTPAGYLTALEQIRASGYAVDDGENEVGACCIAVALPRCETPLALSISGPSTRLTAALVPSLAKQLALVAAELSADVQGATVGAR